MMDIRNALQIELARLRRTDDLPERLPLGPGYLEVKQNGHRYSLQLGGGEGTFLTSRSREDKTKGVEVAKSKPFATIPPEPWMVEISERTPEVKIFDGELKVAGDSSCASETTRSDTEKVFVTWDILKNGNHDLRDDALFSRRPVARREVQTIAHPKLQWIGGREFDQFGEDEFYAAMATIKRIRDAGKFCEGFVYKEASRKYELHWYGWKIKLAENEDGVIVARKVEIKHDHGKQTKTNRVGSVGVALHFPDGTLKLVAWCSLSDVDRCLMSDFDEKLKGRVLEFKHLGWDGHLFEFGQFERWRSDKSADQCLMAEKYCK